MPVPTFVDVGTNGVGSTSSTPGYPAGLASGDYLYLVVSTRAGGTISVPGDWTELIAPFTLSSGMTTGVWRKISDGTESGTITVSVTSGNSTCSKIIAYRPSAGTTLSETVSSGADTTSGTAYSATGGSITSETDDLLITFTGIDDNGTFSARSINQAGATEGAFTNRFTFVNGTGLDSHLEGGEAPVTSGGTGAVTFSVTSSTNVTGTTAFLHLREVPDAVQGQAVASFGGTFTTAGVPKTFGVAVASFGGTFTAAGVDRALGLATASFGGTFTASGIDRSLGQAVADFGGTFTASGTAGAPPVQGQATAAFGGTFTAAGVPEKFGVATTTFGFTGTAAGLDRALGLAVATFGFTGTAAGLDRALGQALATLGGTFTAAGVPEVFGQAVALFGGTFTGSGVVGEPPIPGQATASFGGTFTAAGVDRALGAAVAAFGFTGTAAGVDRALGAAVASFGFTGSAAGVVQHFEFGVAVATFGGTFTADGQVQHFEFGVAVAVFGFSATASGAVFSLIPSAARTIVVDRDNRTIIVPEDVRESTPVSNRIVIPEES